MAPKIVLLSGHVCAGKTTLAQGLARRFDATHVKTGECIQTLCPKVPKERGALQEAGDRLDRKSGGKWVRDALTGIVGLNPSALVVMDAVRIRGQVEAIRASYGSRVLHVHLEASTEELSRRYRRRSTGSIKEMRSFGAVLRNATEREVKRMADIADVVVSSERCSEQDILLRVAAHAGLYGRGVMRSVDVLVGGQYGSEGKGQVAAYLAPEYRLLVRVGGPNAGHKVWQEPEPYTFHQLPSGTNSNPGAHLAIGAGATIRVDKLLAEIRDCQVESDRLSIDPQAMIITEEDIASEQALIRAMGSTGQGVGAATARRITERGLPRNKASLAANERALAPFVRPVADVLDRHFGLGDRIMLEGTQGTGLSLFHGSYPYVTSRDTTVAGCLADAGISPSRVRKVIMVCRTYPIRVQSPNESTSGPMSREIKWSEIAKRAGIDPKELSKTERTSTTKRKRRVGEFDWALLRKSASLNAPTDIALTFMDYLSAQNRHASRVEQLAPESLRFVEEVERVACAPVSLMAVRFHSRAIIDRRRW